MTLRRNISRAIGNRLEPGSRVLSRSKKAASVTSHLVAVGAGKCSRGRYARTRMSQRRRDQEPSARLTRAAAERLQAELDELTGPRAARTCPCGCSTPASSGDIRENAEYDAAKNEQGLMEARIRQLQAMLQDVRWWRARPTPITVGAGMLVTLRPLDDDDADEETYLLAHSKEERAKGARTITRNPRSVRCSSARPSGTRVTYAAPGGEFSYEVVSLRAARA